MEMTGSDVSLTNSDVYEKSSSLSWSKKKLIIVVIIVFAVGIGLGVIIGYFSHPSSSSSSSSSDVDGVCLGPDVPEKIIEDEMDGIFDEIMKRMKAENIDDNLLKFTSEPHLGGTKGEDDLAAIIKDMWTEQGLDHVTQSTYEVLLAYPNATDPSQVFLLDETGRGIIYESQKVEKILSPDQNNSNVVPPFNAYSAKGDVEGDLVYVNYGRIEDFEYLEFNLSVNVSGLIVIARYGKIFRGDKVAIASVFGATGVILYSDPADYSLNESFPVFPDGWWLPGTGVQRGTAKLGDGDPETPGYPSTATAYRTDDPELPKIPVHPIGYDDAYHFLSRLGGEEVKLSDWQGNLNFTYHIGPGFTDNSNLTVKIHVSSNREIANTSNVFGYIMGSVEPDRYVLLGNHRDAWVFGAVDPTSGTAVMMEVSRVLAQIVKEGLWRPRRTIVFCSWGSEEYGLIASYEWVEEQLKVLSERAVAYLNVDLAIEGWESMRAKGVPLLYNLLWDVAKRIPSANNKSELLYDEWLRYFPDRRNPNVPRIIHLGGGSDFVAFIGIAGVPCMDVRYTHNYTIIDYPLYHSVYETYALVKNYMDRDFAKSLAVGLFWAEFARALADPLILPLNASKYSEMVYIFIEDLRNGYGDLLRNNDVSLDGLDSAAESFDDVAKDFMNRQTKINRKNPIEMRSYNDQLMQLERAFITSDGLPLRPLKKHVLFASSTFDSYAGDTFPGLIDLMHGIDRLEGEKKKEQWEKVKEHLATIIYCINSATFILQPTD